jgi:hypothetical protein
MTVNRLTTAIATVAAAAAVTATATVAQSPQAGAAGTVHRVVSDLYNPRGIVHVSPTDTLVTEPGQLRLVHERTGKPATKTILTKVADTATQLAPAVDVGPHGAVYLQTTGNDGFYSTGGTALLYKWRPSYAAPRLIADIGAYQATDPDPDDLQGAPADSNPYGIQVLGNGRILVADAGGNDVLRVSPDGSIVTVARIKPRLVASSADPQGTEPAESVPTAVTVGPDGYWYVAELRGGPGTPGTSEIWRMAPGTRGAVCDPAHPHVGACQRYADGLTSLVSLDSWNHGALYAVSLIRSGWSTLNTSDELGAVYRISRTGSHAANEIGEGAFWVPGGISVARHRVYVAGPSMAFPEEWYVLRFRR